MQGAAATVAVGSVQTVAPEETASVTNGGTPEAAILNFAIPRGATGAEGPAGPQGEAGADGTVVPVALQSLLSASGDVTPADGPLTLPAATVYPAGSGITAAGDTITLEDAGLYEITYNLGYTANGDLSTAQAVLSVGGTPIPSTVRSLNNQTFVNATYIADVGASTPVQVILNTADLTDVNLTVFVKRYSLETA